MKELLTMHSRFCFAPSPNLDGGPRTKRRPPSTKTSFFLLTNLDLLSLSLSFSLITENNSRHHHRPGLPRRRHPVRPAQRRGHGRAMRPDGKRSFSSSLFLPVEKSKTLSHSKTLALSTSKHKKLNKKNLLSVGLPRLPPRLAGQPR